MFEYSGRCGRIAQIDASCPGLSLMEMHPDPDRSRGRSDYQLNITPQNGNAIFVTGTRESAAPGR